jgi:hypothetical protein
MSWLNQERLTVYPRLLLCIYVATYIYLVFPGIVGPNLLDRYGSPIGTDFSGFYSGAVLARSQGPAAVYDLGKMRAAHEQTIGAMTDSIGGWWWVYPPTCLLMMLPFSFLPFFVALGIWLISTFSIYFGAIRRIAPVPQTIWLTLAFPGTYQNFIHAQNGFLSGAFFGWGLFLVDRSPFWGGSLLGLLTYKPQMAALVPIALLAGRRWKALAGAFFSASCLILASFLILGREVWGAYWHFIPVARKLYESGVMPIFKIGTVYNAVLLAGGSYEGARLLQAIVMVAAMAVVFWVWWRDLSLPIRASVLVLGTLLFTPHALPYEFVLLALPLAWLGWEGYSKGWLPAEQPLLLLGWLLPLLIPALGMTRLQLTPLILVTLVVMALRRSRHEFRQIVKQ